MLAKMGNDSHDVLIYYFIYTKRHTGKLIYAYPEAVQPEKLEENKMKLLEFLVLKMH